MSDNYRTAYWKDEETGRLNTINVVLGSDYAALEAKAKRYEEALRNALNVLCCYCGGAPDEQEFCPYCIIEKALEQREEMK